ncbi:MAG TPA: PIG-L family deacetylase [Solirubrobacteraceae bacterium]|jgi:hypothetical protein|nr:PIG-L family deacetylase [Solirubrobacteraceae bacterium]
MYRHRLRRAPAAVARRLRRRREARDTSRLRTRLHNDPDAAPILLSPHWDDAVLDCWALLTQPVELTVVNVFAGIPRPGRLALWDEITGAADSAARARERLAEDTGALALAGRGAINLPLLDAQYRESQPPPSLRAIDRTLAEVVRSTSRVYAPAALGAHVDHKLTRRYAQALLRAGFAVALYADLPYCVTHGWPHWVDGRDPDPHRDVDAFWRTFLVDLPELGDLRAGRVTRLSDPQAAAKLAAMRAYHTQFPSLDGGGVELLGNPATHRFEVVWELSRSRSRGAAAGPEGAAIGCRA